MRIILAISFLLLGYCCFAQQSRGEEFFYNVDGKKFKGTLMYYVANSANNLPVPKGQTIHFGGSKSGTLDVVFEQIKLAKSNHREGFSMLVKESGITVRGDKVQMPAFGQRLFKVSDNDFIKAPFEQRVVRFEVGKPGPLVIYIKIDPKHEEEESGLPGIANVEEISIVLNIAGIAVEEEEKPEVEPTSKAPDWDKLSDAEICELLEEGGLSESEQNKGKDRLKAIDQKAWDKVEQPGKNASKATLEASLKALEDYLEMFPGCRGIYRHKNKDVARQWKAEAEAALARKGGGGGDVQSPEEALWAECQESKTLDCLEKYFEGYPEGTHLKEAIDSYKSLANPGFTSVPVQKPNTQRIQLKDMYRPKLKDLSADDGLEIDTSMLWEALYFDVTFGESGTFSVQVVDQLGQKLPAINLVKNFSVDIQGDAESGITLYVKGGEAPFEISFINSRTEAVELERSSDGPRKISFTPEDFEGMGGSYFVQVKDKLLKEPYQAGIVNIPIAADSSWGLVGIISVVAIGLIALLLFIGWQRKKRRPQTMFD